MSAYTKKIRAKLNLLLTFLLVIFFFNSGLEVDSLDLHKK